MLEKTLLTLMVGCGWLVGSCTVNTSESIAATENPFRQGGRDFSVDFTNCSEYGGLTPVPLENVRNLVPQPNVIAETTTGNATLVVRLAQCEAFSVDGSTAQPGVLAQVGISIIAPNGTGDLNNYTLWYMTDNFELAARLRRAGVNAQFVPGLRYAYTPNGTGGGGDLDVNVPYPASPAFTLSGTVTEPAPTDPGVPYVANWLRLGRNANVQMETTIPNIRFESGDITLHTNPRSELGAVIGGDTITKFTTWSIRGRFDQAHMDVTAPPVPEPSSTFSRYKLTAESGLQSLSLGSISVLQKNLGQNPESCHFSL